MIPLGRAVVRKAGRPRAKNPRVQVAIGLPADVLACWKATGPGWQTRTGVENLDTHLS
jgi:uncharacterized protein (DUF4415 family)